MLRRDAFTEAVVPNSLARRLDVIAPSATLAMNAKAIKLREAGHKVYAYGVGEPDFPTPSHIIEAAYAAAKKGQTKYTPVSGTASLKKAVCAATERDRGWKPTPDMVVVSSGAKHALFNLAVALYEPGDEVIIPAPYWVSYPEQVRIVGAEPVIAQTTEEDGWLLSPEGLEKALTPKTKAIVLCTPSNPTGGAYTQEKLQALASVLAKHDCWIIVDEIYGDLVYGGFEFTSFAKAAPELRDRTIIVDGVSKTYSMTGWRIGWTITPPSLAKALDTVQSQSTSNASSVAQAAAEAALLGSRDEIVAMRATFEKRRDRMVNGLRTLPGVKCRMPEGAFYAFADVRGLLGKRFEGHEIKTDDDVAMYLLEHAKCATVAGSPFGAPGYLRLSYAVSEQEIDEGIEQMRQALSRLT